ncbi:hypothetical protein BH09MYX1_BH09MYX1_44960 [soil metagenome]
MLAVLACGCDKDSPPKAVPSASPSTAASASASVVSSAVVDAAPPAPVVNPVLREERTLDVGGVKETWRLEWTSPARPTCMGDESVASCPCAPFAYGEVGDLDLVRLHPGEPEDRMHLGALFDERDAKLRRWLPTAAEQKAIKAPPLDALQTRPRAPIMTFADYDHDGRATEFLLAIDALSCGYVQTLVVGIDKHDGKLHAFGTAEKPGEPLVLNRPGDWDKVKAKVPTELVETPCGDHAAEVETHVTVTVDANGLHAAISTKKCM